MKNSNDTIGNLTRDFLFVAQYPPRAKSLCIQPVQWSFMFCIILTRMTIISLYTVVPTFFFYYHGGISEIIFYLPWRNLRNKFLYPDDSHAYENENKQKKHLDAYGDYSSTANCRTKIPLLFRRKDYSLRDIFRLLLIHLTVFTELLRVFGLTLLGKNC